MIASYFTGAGKYVWDDVAINLHVFKLLYLLKLTAQQDSNVVPLVCPLWCLIVLLCRIIYHSCAQS